MALSTTKTFSARAVDRAGFFNENGEPRLNIEGTVSLAEEALEANVNVDSTSASYGGTYVGKDSSATNGDFDVAYTSSETVTFSNYPSGISGLHADDIELVRQIDTNGAVVESYTRDDATMSITGDVLTISDASFSATDTFVVLTNIQSGGSTTSSGGAGGGGNNTWSNAQGDFTAAVTTGTTNITLTGLPFTLEDDHVAFGSIKKIDSSGNISSLDTSNATVSGSVITLGNESNFSAGDTVVVSLFGPDKAYDGALDAGLTYVTNPEYNHYTSVETLIDESDLGITDTATGTDSDTLTDTNHTLATIDFDGEQVAVGYEAYSEDEDTAATVLSITDGDNIETDAITDWSSDVYWLPECKRFVIPAEGYNHMAIHVRISTDDATNVAYCKIYGTLDADADDTDDTYWVDLSTDIFGGATLSATNDTTEGLYFVDTSRPMLKYMIKIVAEVIGGGGAAAAGNDFTVYIKKSS